MNRRAILAALVAALPATALSPRAWATYSRGLTPEWASFARTWEACLRPEAAAQVRPTVRRAQRQGYAPADLSGLSTAADGQPFTLCFGDWSAGSYVTVEASRVLRWHQEGPAERWGAT